MTEPAQKGNADHLTAASSILAVNARLRAKIVKNCRLSDADAEAGLAEVIRFLDLCAGADSRLTPSRAVDDVWHEFILFGAAGYKLMGSSHETWNPSRDPLTAQATQYCDRHARFKSFGREIIQGDHVSEITHKNGKVTGIRPEGGYSIETGN